MTLAEFEGRNRSYRTKYVFRSYTIDGDLEDEEEVVIDCTDSTKKFHWSMDRVYWYATRYERECEVEMITADVCSTLVVRCSVPMICKDGEDRQIS